jgi:hypothetical protein
MFTRSFRLLLICSLPLFAEFDFSMFRTAGIFITEIAYSGLPNPSFTIRDSNDVDKIIQALTPFASDTVDSNLIRKPDSTWQACYAPWSANIGYRGLIMTSKTVPHVPFSIGNQTVLFNKDSSSNSCRYMWDKKTALEKLLIAILSKDSTFNLSSIPDSLRPAISIEKERFKNIDKTLIVRPNSEGILLEWQSFNETSVQQILNVQGKIVYTFRLDRNTCRVFLSYSSLHLSNGVYMLKSSFCKNAILFFVLH